MQRRPSAPAYALAAIALFVASPGQAGTPDCIDYPLPFNNYGGAAIDLVGGRAFEVGGSFVPPFLRVLDYADPGVPDSLATLALSGAPVDVVVDGDVAFVAAGAAGLLLVDVSSPGAPVVLGSLPSSLQAKAVAVSGDFAYLLDTAQGLLVVDIADPGAPDIVGSLVWSGGPTDIAVAGAHAFITDQSFGLIAMTIADPTQPGIVGFAPTPGNALAVALSGSYAYVADDSAGVQVVDIANPAALDVVGAVDTPGSARGLCVDGTHVYVADTAGGCHILSIADPENPASLFAVETDFAALAVDGAGGWAYVLSGARTLAIDVFAPAPPIRGSVPLTRPPRGLEVVGEYCYALSDSGRLDILHVDEISGPDLVGSLDPPGLARVLAVQGDYAYLLSTYSTLQIVDVSDRAAPFLAGSITPPGGYFLQGLDVVGHRAYIGAQSDGSGRLLVIDVTTAAAPVYLTEESVGRPAGRLIATATHAYVSTADGSGSTGIRTFDITDLSDIRQTDAFGGYFSLACVANGRMCLTRGNGPVGAWIYSLADPSNPSLIGSVPGLYAGGAAFLGNSLYVTTGGTALGFQVLDVTDPATPSFAGAMDTPGPTGPVAVSSEYIFFGDGSGVTVAYRHCDATAVSAGVPPPRGALLALPWNVPNPFRGSTAIAYDLPSPGPARMDIYDVTGRHVRTLVHERASAAGRHTATWDGRDRQGQPVGPGVYFVRLRADAGEARRRVTLLR